MKNVNNVIDIDTRKPVEQRDDVSSAKLIVFEDDYGYSFLHYFGSKKELLKFLVNVIKSLR